MIAFSCLNNSQINEDYLCCWHYTLSSSFALKVVFIFHTTTRKNMIMSSRSAFKFHAASMSLMQVPVLNHTHSNSKRVVVGNESDGENNSSFDESRKLNNPFTRSIV